MTNRSTELEAALRLALEALNEWRVEWSPDFYEEKYDSDEPEENTRRTLIKRAITAIKKVLMSVPDGAQPEQEPVGWVDDGGEVFWKDKPPVDGEDIYTTPPQRKPLTDEQMEILQFLDGSRPLDGVWFGEEHPKALQGKYWWRRHLHRAFDIAVHGIKEKNT